MTESAQEKEKNLKQVWDAEERKVIRAHTDKMKGLKAAQDLKMEEEVTRKRQRHESIEQMYTKKLDELRDWRKGKRADAIKECEAVTTKAKEEFQHEAQALYSDFEEAKARVAQLRKQNEEEERAKWAEEAEMAKKEAG